MTTQNTTQPEAMPMPVTAAEPRTTDRQYVFLGRVILIRKSCGWGGVFRPKTIRQFAVYVEGDILTKTNGHVRTFATREAALKAGKEKVIRDEDNLSQTKE